MTSSEHKKVDKFNIQFGLLYCIAIIMIVASHATYGGFKFLGSWLPWNNCQIPLFAFCSGYFFINNQKRSTKTILFNKFKKFIIPLILWNIFYGILVTILKSLGIIKFGSDLSFNSLFLAPLWNGHQFLFNLASWFIAPLFITEILNIIPARIVWKHKKAFVPYFIICLAIGVFGVQFAINGNAKIWGLLFSKVCLFIPFFAGGLLYKSKLEQKDTLKNIPYFLILIAITLIATYLNGKEITYITSQMTGFQNCVSPFVGGFLGIAFLLRITKIIAPVFTNSHLVKLISKNTFAIMMHHLLGFFIINCILLAVHRITGHMDFNEVKFATNVQYLYLPKGISQFSLIYIIFGILFSIHVGKITKKIKETILHTFLSRRRKIKQPDYTSNLQ